MYMEEVLFTLDELERGASACGRSMRPPALVCDYYGSDDGLSEPLDSMTSQRTSNTEHIPQDWVSSPEAGCACTTEAGFSSAPPTMEQEIGLDGSAITSTPLERGTHLHSMTSLQVAHAIERANLLERFGRKSEQELREQLQDVEAKAARLEHKAMKTKFDVARYDYEQKLEKLRRRRDFLGERIAALDVLPVTTSRSRQ